MSGCGCERDYGTQRAHGVKCRGDARERTLHIRQSILAAFRILILNLTAIYTRPSLTSSIRTKALKL